MAGTLLTPVIATWITPFTAYLIILSVRVTRLRISTRTALGERIKIHPDESNPVPPASLAPLDPMNVDRLTLAVRSHANYVECIPWCFVAAGIVELNGGNATALNVMLGLLLAGRVAHVELGLKGQNTLGKGRFVGMTATWGFMSAMSGYATWLARSNWGL